MTDNVVNLALTPKSIWVCDCGCSTFYVVSDGSAECAACTEVAGVPLGGWKDFDHDKTSEIEHPTSDVSANGLVEFARRRIVSLASDEDAVLVIVAKSNSWTCAWSEVETPEQMEGVRKRLKDAEEIIGLGIAGAEGDNSNAQ